MASRNTMTVGKRLIHHEYGEPTAILSMEEFNISEPENDEVLLEMLAAPLNPVDINIMQGRYTFKPTLPNVPGYEGVGKVLKVGKDVKKLSAGDHVITNRYLGTFRTHLTVSEDSLMKIPNTLELAEAAMLAINPSTAYRMLKDFVNLEKGDAVIQNAANSACGLIVIQLCRAWGINTVNVVRDRLEIESLKTFLKEAGATVVLTEDEIKSTDVFKSGKLRKPKLALNCVGGQNAVDIMRYLEVGGTMVTYGGMSMQHMPLPSSFFIFKDYRMVGLNIGVWLGNEDNAAERERMFKELCDLIQKGSLKAPPYVLIDLENYKDAFHANAFGKGMIGKKYIFELNKYNSKL